MKTIVRAAGRLPAGYSAIGDDVASIPSGRGKLVMKVDMLVERTDMPKGMTYRQAARKSVAMCVSDFAAKGVRPGSFMVSLGLKRGTSMEQVEELAYGLNDAQKEWGVRLVGGDTNEAGELVIDCVMVGFGGKVVGRSGAKPGDVLVVTGPFGFPPAGLKILDEGAVASKQFRRRAMKNALNPAPCLDVGLALAPHLTAGMDSSDGLARSLHTIASMSRVGFELTSLPVGRGVKAFSRANGLDPERLVLAGGEEYVVVGTVAPRHLRRARRVVGDAGGNLMVIGRATDKVGVVVLGEGRAEKRIADEGWTHLG